MNKFLKAIVTGVFLLVALCLFPFSAFAAEEISVAIPVEIEGGGTAVVITAVNCPPPLTALIEVSNGMTESINISFSEPGNYSYRIEAESETGRYYAPEYYTASVAVRGDGDELYATTVLTKSDSDYKPDVCSFTQAEKPGSDPTEPSETQAVTPTQPEKTPPTSRPKTGDDSKLDIYLLICIAASGGLFMLSVIYAAATRRLIGK